MTKRVKVPISVTRRTEEVFEVDREQLHGFLCVVFGWAKSGKDFDVLAPNYSNGQLADQFLRERMNPVYEDVPAEAHSTETPVPNRRVVDGQRGFLPDNSTSLTIQLELTETEAELARSGYPYEITFGVLPVVEKKD